MVPGQQRHGGNTVCLEVIHPGTERVVFDAGTGLPNLGAQILADSPAGGPVHLFLSHYHWDHILGLPLFGPIYCPGFDIHLYGLHASSGALREMLNVVFAPAYSPIYSPQNLLGNLILPPESDSYEVGDLLVNTVDIPGIHPSGCLLFRVTLGNKSFVYAPDVELRDDSVVEPFVEFCSGCDLLVCNAAFSQADFERSVGCGHSSLEVAADVARRARVRSMLGVHFDPLRTDEDLERALRRQQEQGGLQVDLAREGQEVLL